MPETRQRLLTRPYDKHQFRYEQDSDRYICPAGQSLAFQWNSWQRGERVREYRAAGDVCRACSAFGECTTSPRGRMMIMSPREQALVRHREWMATAEARAASRRRGALAEPGP